MSNEGDAGHSTPTVTDFRVTPSLACDLSWVLSVAIRPSSVKKEQLRARAFDQREELADRVRAFWADSPADDTCFTEMQILAHHAGAISETSPAALWKAIAEAVDTVPLDLGLESESETDRVCFLERLAMLKASPARVRQYIELLQEVWEPMDAEWQAALPVLYDTGQHHLDRLQAGHPFQEMVSVRCDIFAAHLPQIVERVEQGRTLLLVPCYFFGSSLYLEFPDLTLIGMGLEEHGSMARARTESVARRLKTVADPTRLALLHFLSARPSSVSDLAASFGLAQPTVSMHVKLLRETGLVTAERHGGRLQLQADPDAVDSLLSDLRGVVVQPTAHAASAN
jgi:DNA-binding transcriptional ArsR family regulator